MNCCSFSLKTTLHACVVLSEAIVHACLSSLIRRGRGATYRPTWHCWGFYGKLHKLLKEPVASPWPNLFAKITVASRSFPRVLIELIKYSCATTGEDDGIQITKLNYNVFIWQEISKRPKYCPFAVCRHTWAVIPFHFIHPRHSFRTIVFRTGRWAYFARN